MEDNHHLEAKARGLPKQVLQVHLQILAQYNLQCRPAKQDWSGQDWRDNPSTVRSIAWTCQPYATQLSWHVSHMPPSCLDMSAICHPAVLTCQPYATQLSWHVSHMPPSCLDMSAICHPAVLTCQPYAIQLSWHVSHMPPSCLDMSAICHPAVLTCQPYATQLSWHVSHMPPSCLDMSAICHPAVLTCQPYATQLSWHVSHMPPSSLPRAAPQWTPLGKRNRGQQVDVEVVHWERPPRWPSGKASASRAEDPGFESRLCRDFFGVESYQRLKNWHSSGYPARRLAY